jgi:rod shape-determining protein MreC
LFQKHLSELLLAVYTVFCLSCLAWSADPAVRTVKLSLEYLLSPASTEVLEQMETLGDFGRNASRLLRLDADYRRLEWRWRLRRLDEKRLRALEAENRRLTSLLNLTPPPEFSPQAARVLARDSGDWFHSVLIDRGLRSGVRVSDPVVAFQSGREVLVGQVIETRENSSRVLLVTDPLSAVSARVQRTGEEGAVEGQGVRRLVMNYLLSDSDVKPGDEVVTAGLGRIFPESIHLGTVERVEGDRQDVFKRAYLLPAAGLSRLNEVMVLRRRTPGGRP